MTDIAAGAELRALKAAQRESGSEQAAAHWETSAWPFVVALGVLLALPLAFSLHFVYARPMAAVFCLGIGVPLTVWGVVGWVREAIAGHGEGLVVPAMPWFILAEALIFLAFFAAYWFMRLSAPVWPPAGSVPMPKLVPAVMTVLLLASSVTYHAAEAAYDRGRAGGFLGWLLATLALGAAFLGLSGYEWRELAHAGFGFGANAYSTAFYSITGFHAAHVLAGVGIFLAVLGPALVGRTNRHFIAAAGIYWHFVDVVWLFVVTQLYFW
ncbi:MAG: heme-copper oxidase subunit III [Pseudomonadota bacterium]